MPVSNQRHPACKANVRYLETLLRNGFEGIWKHAGKFWGNFQSLPPEGAHGPTTFSPAASRSASSRFKSRRLLRMSSLPFQP